MRRFALCTFAILVALISTVSWSQEDVADELARRTAESQARWISDARDYLAQHPESTGLEHFIRALELLDFEERIDPSQHLWPNDNIVSMLEIPRRGWIPLSEAQLAALQAQEPALREYLMMADGEELVLPPLDSLEDPNERFSFVQFGYFTRLLLIEARRSQASGQPDKALERAIQTARGAALLASNHQRFGQYWYALSDLKLALQVTEDLLWEMNASEDSLREASDQLAWIEAHAFDDAAALRSEFPWSLRSWQDAARDPRPLSEVCPMLASAESSEISDSWDEVLSRWDEFEPEFIRLWEWLIEDAEREPWERVSRDPAAVERQTDVAAFAPEFSSTAALLNRGGEALAQLRQCQGVIQLLLGEEDPENPIIDPRTGEPWDGGEEPR